MAELNNSVFDNGLSSIPTNNENLHILSADPGIVFSNIALFLLGTKAAPIISAPADRGGGGREVTVSAITDGAVSATGTATHYALTDDTGTEIQVSAPLGASQAVTNGNVFTLTAFTVGIPDPA